MSYDIELKNKVTGETATMRHPQYVRGKRAGKVESDDGGIRADRTG